MSKLQTLKKQVIREGVMVGGVVVMAFVVMMGTGYLADGALESKNREQAQYTQSQSQLGVMRSQILKSKDAEKRYVDIRLDRDNDDFLNDTNGLKELLKQMKEQYRFSDNMRLTISTDKASERPEFLGLNYRVIVREDMEMSTAGISDVHIFSFLQDLQRRVPGILRVKELKLTRKSTMSFENLSQLGAGSKLEMVDAMFKFTWLTLEDKTPPAESAPDASTPTTDGMMGGTQ